MPRIRAKFALARGPLFLVSGPVCLPADDAPQTDLRLTRLLEGPAE